MAGYLLRRAAWSGAAMLVFVTVVFVVVASLPYDYASAYGFGCRACALEERESLGLDRPLPVRYLDFLADLARGSLGDSFAGPSVRDVLLGPPLWNTLLVFGIAALVAFVVGSSVGRVAAWRGRPTRLSLTGISVLAYTLFPPFLVFVIMRFGHDPMRSLRELLGVPADELHLWQASSWSELAVLRFTGATLLVGLVGALALRFLARRRRWHRGIALAAPAGVLAIAVGSWWVFGVAEQALTVLFHAPRFAGGGGIGLAFQSAAGQGGGNPFIAIVAVLALAFGEIVLVLEASMRSELDEHYVLTARAKGIEPRDIRDHHVTRNAVLPALSRFMVGLPILLTGLIIVERELEIRGLSTVFFDAARQADLPVVLGALVVFGFITLAARLALDVAHVLLDPRIRARGLA